MLTLLLLEGSLWGFGKRMVLESRRGWKPAGRQRREMASSSPWRSGRRHFPHLPISHLSAACGVSPGKTGWDSFSPPSVSWGLASAWGNSCSAPGLQARRAQSRTPGLTPALISPSARELAPAGSCTHPTPLLPIDRGSAWEGMTSWNLSF